MSYNTAQRKAVLDFFLNNDDKHFTVEEVYSHMENVENRPGKSSVYRIVTQLCDEGRVKRFVDGKRFLYQAVGCSDSCAHLHFKCELCERIFHASQSATKAVSAAIMDNMNFEIDNKNNYILGKCPDCAKKKENGGQR